jgi:signal transduction histidine kinase/DNA-binding response OmpR family regulator
MTKRDEVPESGRVIEPASALLASWRVTPGERRFALAVVLVSLMFFVAAAPFAKLPLLQVWAFIPIYESALIINDLITAVLLFGQFRIGRSKALFALASGYVFTACATVAHGLSFPGLFSPTGLLGAGPQSTAWLYMFWHGGFPLFVVAYVLLRGRPAETQVMSGRLLPKLAVLGATVGGVVAVTLLATAGHGWLPPIMSGNRYTPTMIVIVSSVWSASLLALALLYWRRRPQTVLDLWLMVVMCAWLFDIALSAGLNAGRFDLGFYAGRVYGLLATGFVLVRLLLENASLHDRLLGLTHKLEATNVELAQSNLQLKKQSQFKSEFLANMSHELRTPLNAIIGFSALMMDDTPRLSAEQRRTFIGHVNQSGHHLLALINDILELSKIEAGKFDIELASVDLRATVAEAITMVTAQAQARGVRLQRADRGVIGEFAADRRRVKQIVLNLVNNAVKFSSEGGVVTVEIGLCDRAQAANALPGFGEGVRMPLPESEFDRYVEISVSDTGIGISRDDMQRLFQPFTQVGDAVARRAEGTGLGLAMVERLAQLHGGTVAMTSEPGQGSCFTVWLPWRQESRAEVEKVAAPKPAQRRLALVVEDDEAAAALMRRELETEGFDVRCVPSAEAALALSSECVPDVITLDIKLPGMDGWEFLSRVKGESRWESVPVVVVSIAADQRQGFSLGAALVLQKPLAPDSLANGLERLGLTPRPGQQVKVLVIDDDPLAVDLLAAQLHERKYTVLRALGGRQGIELAQRARPDLITLDLEMPEVNGFDVVEALEASPSTAHIPIVVVTAKDPTSAERQRLNGHIRNIVGKVDLPQRRFVAEVQRALSLTN